MQTEYPSSALRRVLKQSRYGLAVCGACLSLMPATGFAQAANEVTLRFANGQDSISGTLVKFEDDKYFVRSSIGLAAIPVLGVTCEGLGCPLIFESLDGENTVVLTSTNFDLTLRGTLLGFENGTYSVNDLTYGQVEVNASEFDCAGTACPEQ